MSSGFDLLLSMKVDSVFCESEVLGIAFSSGSRLTIYNDVILNGKELSLTRSKTENFLTLIGMSIMSTVIRGKRIAISFSEGIELDIRLDDPAWHGPEILEVNIPGEPIMVMNEIEES